MISPIAFRPLLLSTTCAIACLLVPQGHSQRISGSLSANVPFAFQAGTVEMDAGKYNINTPMAFVMNVHGAHSGEGPRYMNYLWDTAPKVADHSKLVFHCYGHRYFLREVHIAGSRDYLYLTEPKAEKQLRREMESAQANNKVQPTQPEVAALNGAH